MAKSIDGLVVFAEFEKQDSFLWQDPATGQSKPIRSLKVLMAHGDKTVTRESLTLPPNYELPALKPGEKYGFPVVVSINKKKQILSWNLRSDMAPFPAPRLE